jgi:hypothetical protein
MLRERRVHEREERGGEERKRVDEREECMRDK